MRVLHVAWEYPPLIYGGLGRHVEALTQAQARRGDEVIVLTQAAEDQAAEDRAAEDRAGTERVGSVRVLRAPHEPEGLPFREDTLLAWVEAMQTGMLRAAVDLGPVDIVHAHDWVTAQAAIALQGDLPARGLVCTIHATEAGRHQGWLPGPLSDAIHSVEHRLVHSADSVVVCSQHMAHEVGRLFDCPGERVSVIPNGIDLERWRASESRTVLAREQYAGPGPLLAFVGRLEWEKGAHTLIDALPRLRRRIPGLRVVIAGRGGHEQALMEQAQARRVARAIDFVGWLPEPDLHALIAAADALVIPSIYEPFGLVAVEGAALGTPLVVARTGGLAEFVCDEQTGHTFSAGDPAALADAVTKALRDPDGSARMARQARAKARDEHDWSRIAEQTDQAYARALLTPRAREPIPPARLPGRSVNLLGP